MCGCTASSSHLRGSEEPSTDRRDAPEPPACQHHAVPHPATACHGWARAARGSRPVLGPQQQVPARCDAEQKGGPTEPPHNPFPPGPGAPAACPSSRAGGAGPGPTAGRRSRSRDWGPPAPPAWPRGGGGSSRRRRRSGPQRAGSAAPEDGGGGGSRSSGRGLPGGGRRLRARPLLLLRLCAALHRAARRRLRAADPEVPQPLRGPDRHAPQVRGAALRRGVEPVHRPAQRLPGQRALQGAPGTAADPGETRHRCGAGPGPGPGGRPRRRRRGRRGAAGSCGSAAGGTARHSPARHGRPGAPALGAAAVRCPGSTAPGTAPRERPVPAAFPRGNFNFARLRRRLSSTHVCAASENLFHPSGGKRSGGWDNKRFSFKRGGWR